jgi:peptidyl-prolyl cis-trans isomerase NIMA-interacting 1
MSLYRAILLGTATGDALGLPYEGARRPRDVRGGSIVSDDTERAVLVARSLARHPRDRECVRPRVPAIASRMVRENAVGDRMGNPSRVRADRARYRAQRRALGGAIHGDAWVGSPRSSAFGTHYLEALARDLENGTSSARFSWAFALLTNVLTFPCMLAHTMKALVFLPVLALACGGAKPPEAKGTPDDSGESGLETPDTRCLAIARGTRERKNNEPPKITAKHILVKYAGAKNAPADIKRTQGAACLRALEARKQLQSGEPFANVVKEYSDEAGAATREGSVGQISRKDVAAPFADAAFELAPNEVSHVVETEFGYHIIMRVE